MKTTQTLCNIEEFLKWLATKPDEETFKYSDIENSAMAQFAKWKFPDESDIRCGGTHIIVGATLYLLPSEYYYNMTDNINTFGKLKQLFANPRKLKTCF